MEKQYVGLHKFSKKYLPIELFKRLGFKDVTAEQISNNLTSYGLSLVLATIVFLVTFYSAKQISSTLFYLLLMLAVAVGTWSKGVKSGVSTAILTGGEAFYFFVFPKNQSQAIFELVVFVFVASAIIYLLDEARKTREIEIYRKKEKQYATNFMKLLEDYEKAKREIKARDEFLALASHELKTPLTSMLLQLNLTLHSVRNVSLSKFSVAQLMKTLENAERQIKRLTKMINDLLDVSLITTGRLDLEPEKVDLARIARNVVDSFSQTIKREKYKVKLETNGKVNGKWDKVRVEQAVTNLVSNALKYGNGKPITIKVYNNATKAVFSISDQGVGIPSDKLESLFERFKRANSDKKGLGVGLYVVSQIARAHKGDVKVESKPGKGSMFRLELPLER